MSPPQSPSILPLPTAVPYDNILSPKVDVDIITVDALSSVGSLKDEISKNAPRFVVIRRPYEDQNLNYAFKLGLP